MTLDDPAIEQTRSAPPTAIDPLQQLAQRDRKWGASSCPRQLFTTLIRPSTGDWPVVSAIPPATTSCRPFGRALMPNRSSRRRLATAIVAAAVLWTRIRSRPQDSPEAGGHQLSRPRQVRRSTPFPRSPTGGPTLQRWAPSCDTQRSKSLGQQRRWPHQPITRTKIAPDSTYAHPRPCPPASSMSKRRQLTAAATDLRQPVGATRAASMLPIHDRADVRGRRSSDLRSGTLPRLRSPAACAVEQSR
jgi:hypothetical protein